MMSTTYGISRQTQRSCLVPDLRNTQAAYGPSKASIPENVMRERVTRAVSHRNQNGRTFLSFGSNKLLVTVVILLIYCIGFSSAAATPRPTSVSVEAIDYEIYEAYLSRLAKLAETGTILADLSTPPLPVAAEIEAIQGDLRRRATGTTASLHSSITIDTSVPSKTPTPKVTNSTTTAASATTTLAPSPIPSPYDGNIGTNFTVQTCPDFINSFLVNPTFKSCLPFSLLLQNSNSFFQASKSLVRITQTLDYTCAANVTSCTAYLSTLAANLTTSSNCLADYNLQNPIVRSAYIGLIAYKPLYQASCLKDPVTSSYCFGDAITNATSPEDSYVYYLPLNDTLPGGAQPTCSTCLQNTMAVFSANAANRTQPVANTYIDAAKLININCGPGFVNATIPLPLSSGAGGGVTPGLGGLLAVGLVVLGMLIL